MLNNLPNVDIKSAQDSRVKREANHKLQDPNLQEPILQESRPSEYSAKKTATDFETAFIAQMLQFSGLAKALTSGGGEAMQSFTQFYIEELAQGISEQGGFGIADKISAYINATTSKTKDENYVELGKL